METRMEPVQIAQIADTTHVTLPARLGAAQARALYEALSAALATAGTIILDSAQVQRIDAAAMQVLANFSRTARARALALVWQNPSSELQQAAQLLDLQAMLELHS
jgi:anti-anti-sigma regulatory factor